MGLSGHAAVFSQKNLLGSVCSIKSIDGGAAMAVVIIIIAIFELWKRKILLLLLLLSRCDSMLSAKNKLGTWR